MLEELYAAEGFCAVAPAHVEEPEMQTVTVVEPVDESIDEPIDEPTKKTKNKAVTKGLDHDKIIACHKDGRSVAWIADEMGCTLEAVRYHIKKETDK